MKHIIFIALKLILARKRQTAISVLGVALGITAFVAMSSLMFGFQKYFIEQAVNIEPHIEVKPRKVFSETRVLEKNYPSGTIFEVLSSKPKDVKDKIIDYKFLIDRYSKDPLIEGGAPHLKSQIIIKFGSVDATASVIGINPAEEVKATSIESMLENKKLYTLIQDPQSIILGKILAQDIGVKKLGDKVIVVAPSGNIFVLKVVDFFNSGIVGIDKSRAYVNIKTLQKILEVTDQVNEVVFRVKDPKLAEEVARKMQDELPKYEVRSWQRSLANVLKLFLVQNIITFMIVFAILTVSGFGIFNIMLMTVMEKRREIAILKAIGYERKEIVYVFLFQSLLIGVAGALIGILGGYFVQLYLESVDITVEGILKSRGFILDKNPLYFLYGSLFAIGFAVLASIYPAYKAGKLNPIEIFRAGA